MQKTTRKSQDLQSGHYSTVSMMRRIFSSYLRPYLGTLLLALVFMIVSAGMTGVVAKLLQPVMDNVLGGDDTALILPFALGVMGIFVLRGGATYAHVLLMNTVSQGIVADIQKALFAHFLTLDQAFYTATPSGEMISRVTADVNVMRSTVSGVFTSAGKSVFTLIFLIAVMFSQDPWLALAAFTIFPLLAGFVVYLGQRLRRISRSLQSGLAGLTSALSQVFQGIRHVQSYGMEDDEIQKTSKEIDRVRQLNIKSVRVGNLSTPVNELLVGLVFFGIITYGGYQVKAGAMTAGQLVSFLGALMLAYEPMKRLAKLNNTLQMGLGAAQRVFEILDRKPEITSPDVPVALPEDALHEVVFRDVSFCYAGADATALDAVSFSMKPNTVTALVGPSGGGKSTVMSLIPRFYDVTEGALTIAGVDVRDMALTDLRKRIAFVSQDVTIFDDTVHANIAYGSLGATQEDVHRAAKMAAADGFIEEMAQGYDTRVGESGVLLSGGQRQRISIARAILRDSPILLLDEATSALDNESEKQVQDALESLGRGRTTLVIAHRLSTVREADHIIVLDGGAIAERGTHETLMALDGVYTKMYTMGLKE